MVTPAERTAYLYARGELRRFPEGGVLGVPTDLDALAASEVISPEGVERAALDLTMGPDPERDTTGADGGDESVGSLVRRRLGDEVYEVLVGPLLSGVNAGNADELSVAAGAPQFAAAMRDHGSLIAGARAQRAAAAAGPGADAPVFYGLDGGMGSLVDALVAEITTLGGHILPATALRSVRPTAPDGSRLEITVADQAPQEVDAVVLATPLPVTAQLLEPLLPEVARDMAAVEYASAVMVTLAVPRDQIDHLLDASGFLVPHREGLLLTACSWASVKWAHLSRPDSVLLRASAGRHGDERALEPRRRRPRRRAAGRPRSNDGASWAADHRSRHPLAARAAPVPPGPPPAHRHVARGHVGRRTRPEGHRSRIRGARHPGVRPPGSRDGENPRPTALLAASALHQEMTKRRRIATKPGVSWRLRCAAGRSLQCFRNNASRTKPKVERICSSPQPPPHRLEPLRARAVPGPRVHAGLRLS